MSKSKSNPWETNSDSYVDRAGHLVTIRSNGTRQVELSCEGDPGRTEQSHKDSCDISFILNQHLRSGGVPPLPDQVFQDLTLMPDYQTCLNTVMDIDNLFSNLPLEVRVAYDHNPALFMQAVEDPLQRDTLTKLGVFEAKVGLPVTGSDPLPD